MLISSILFFHSFFNVNATLHSLERIISRYNAQSSPILISSSQPETIDDFLNTTEDEGDGQAFKYNFRRSLFSRFIQSFLVLVKNGCRTGSPSMKSWSSPCLFS